MRQRLAAIVQEHEKVAVRSFGSEQLLSLEKIAQAILQALEKGKKILLCGNGGSAADCQHIAAEFIVRFKKERKSFPAIALTTDTSILTSTANDYNFGVVFKRQVEGLGAKGDVLIAISTSGNSENVLEAVRAAKKIGMVTVGLTGGTGGKLISCTDLNFCAQSSETARIQEMHITALHAISEVVEDRLFS